MSAMITGYVSSKLLQYVWHDKFSRNRWSGGLADDPGNTLVYYPAMKTVTKSLKLPADLARQLAAQARELGCPESDLIREGIVRVIRERTGLDMARLLAGDVGIGSGPADLSAGRRHWAGYGRSRDC